MDNSNVNFVLLYLSTGLNEQIFLSDSFSKDEKTSKDKIICEQNKISNRVYFKKKYYNK